ncbi:hypothetical protein [Chitinophaga sp. sic0106]|nr:hypothetical protein [Chitinophaga sp. sic0106]MBV7532860.1 hypothetical protein [Chitinophaga sp. sic0106]
MKKKKSYDAVAEARRIKEEMSLKYFGKFDLLLKELKEVRKRYKLRTQKA